MKVIPSFEVYIARVTLWHRDHFNLDSYELTLNHSPQALKQEDKLLKPFKIFIGIFFLKTSDLLSLLAGMWNVEGIKKKKSHETYTTPFPPCIHSCCAVSIHKSTWISWYLWRRTIPLWGKKQRSAKVVTKAISRWCWSKGLFNYIRLQKSSWAETWTQMTMETFIFLNCWVFYEVNKFFKTYLCEFPTKNRI